MVEAELVGGRGHRRGQFRHALRFRVLRRSAKARHLECDDAELLREQIVRRAQPQPAGAVQVYERRALPRLHVSDAEPIRLDKAFAKSLSHVLPFQIKTHREGHKDARRSRRMSPSSCPSSNLRILRGRCFNLDIADVRQHLAAEQFELLHHRASVARAGIGQADIDDADADLLARLTELLDHPLRPAAEADG